MAVILNGSGTALTSSASSYVASRTLSTFTVGGGANRVMYAQLTLTDSGAASPSVTWNGVAMTLIGTQSIGLSRQRIYRLVNPATGNLSLAASWTTNYPARLGVICLTGVDQSTPDNANTPVAATGTSTALASGAIATSANDATLGFACISDPASGTAAFSASPETQTSIYRETASTELAVAATYALGGSSNSHDFTSAGSDTWGVWGFRVFSVAAVSVAPRAQAHYRRRRAA
jgi:hypothetical protein